MTVCIGALSDDGKSVVLAADRMVTRQFPPVEYEDHNKKVFRISSDFYILVAGTLNSAADIIELGKQKISESDTAGVKFEKMRQAYVEFRERKINEEILVKHGMTLQEFKAIQRNLVPQIAVEIQNQIQNANLTTDFILIGIDHGIFVMKQLTHPGTLNNPLEYVAIGSGTLHATQSLIASRYSKQTSKEISSYLVFEAKKRAEVTPGVGRFTDMFVIELAPDGNPVELDFPESSIKKLDKVYEKINKRSSKKISQSLTGVGFSINLVDTSGEREHQHVSGNGKSKIQKNVKSTQ